MGTKFMTAKETAEYLSVSVSWLYGNAARLGLASYRFGGGANAKMRFRVSEVESWVKQQRVTG